MQLDKDLQSVQEVRDLIKTAKEAQRALARMDQAQIDKIVAAISAAGAEHAGRLAAMAVEETGFGRKEDKELKNRFAALTLYEAIKNERTIGILAEDQEKRIIDIGVPVGIVAGLVPSTNPTSTVIYKAMICLKAGSPIIFSPHPSALNCIRETVAVVRRAAEGAGAPAGSISCISTPTMEATSALMKHRDTRLILATGGGAMVKAAYSSGTPAIGVGAGNGPAYIHRTADVPMAVKRILDSKTFDNGTICASEQSIVVTREMEPAVTAELTRQGACILSDGQHKALSKCILRPNGTMNPAIVGKSVEQVAALAGLTGIPAGTRVLVARETGVGPGYPYSNEKLGADSGPLCGTRRGGRPPPVRGDSGVGGRGPHLLHPRRGRERGEEVRRRRARQPGAGEYALLPGRHRRQHLPVPRPHPGLRRSGRLLQLQQHRPPGPHQHQAGGLGRQRAGGPPGRPGLPGGRGNPGDS